MSDQALVKTKATVIIKVITRTNKKEDHVMEAYLKKIEEIIAQGPYTDTWESLQKYRVPEWYQKKKFGIFIHWGIYSVPSFGNEWYSRNMYIQGTPEYEHHIKAYGLHKEFGYKDFIPMFTADKFHPEAWFDLFEQAGAEYIVPVAEHHDGFQMYKSKLSHWNSDEMGPNRDVLGELSAEAKKRGMVNGASSHRVEHWFFMGHGKDFDSDIKEPLKRGDFYWPSMKDGNEFGSVHTDSVPTEEFLQDWLVRTCEIIDEYHPQILYFDWWIQHFSVKPYLKKLAAYYYNRAAQWGQEVVINYKHDAFFFGTAVPDVERGQFAEMKPYLWQTDTSIALNSWGYTENNQFRPANDILCDLVDIVSKNGRLLLNIGPRPDGTITQEETDILREIGEWLHVNGEAIYGSSVWRKYGEGPTEMLEGQFTDGIRKNFTSEDIRFTTGNGYLYATALKCSDDGKYCIKSLGILDASKIAHFSGIIRDITLLGCKTAPHWTQDGEGLKLQTDYKTDKPVVFKIQID